MSARRCSAPANGSVGVFRTRRPSDSEPCGPEVKKKGLEADKERTEEDKESLLEDMAEALADRTAENQNFGDAKEDDLKARRVLSARRE